MSTCPGCGYQNIPQASFCQSCGTPIPAQPSNKQYWSQPSQYYQQRSGLGAGATVIIIVVILIAVVVVAVAASVFVFYTTSNFISRVSPGAGPVTVSGVYLAIVYPSYATGGYFGTAYRVLIPGTTYLQHGQSLSIEFTLTLTTSNGNHTVDRVTLGFSGGFTIQSINPTPPVNIVSGSSVTFAATVIAPSTNYNGPVTIDLFTH